MQTNDQPTLLNEPPEVNASETVVVLDSPDAFDHAWAEQSKRELGAGFANRCLSVAMGMGVALVLSVSFNVGMGWKLISNPSVKYFTTENGRVTEVHPLDEPAYSQSDVAAFGADTIRDSFTLDFVHYRDQMTRAGPRYNEVGYEGYYKALTTSNVLTAVRDQRMNLSVEVGPGVIRSKGAPGGVHTWEFQYPVTLKLDGQQTSSPAQRFIFTQRIQRADERVKNAGLEVTQVITSNAN